MKHEHDAEAKLEASSQVPNNLSPTFCVAMLKNNSAVKIEGKVDEFLQTIKDADFAWVNVQVANFEEEATNVASALGFNPSLIQELVK